MYKSVCHNKHAKNAKSSNLRKTFRGVGVISLAKEQVSGRIITELPTSSSTCLYIPESHSNTLIQSMLLASPVSMCQVFPHSTLSYHPILFFLITYTLLKLKLLS